MKLRHIIILVFKERENYKKTKNLRRIKYINVLRHEKRWNQNVSLPHMMCGTVSATSNAVTLELNWHYQSIRYNYATHMLAILFLTYDSNHRATQSCENFSR